MDSSRCMAWACALVIGLCAAGSGKAGGIARCVGAQGEPMFAPRCGSAPGAPQNAAARDIHARAAPARGSAGAANVCARSPQQLAERVQAAIHARNGVRLSGYALWRGSGGSGVRAQMRELWQLLRSGIADVQLRQRGDMHSGEFPDEAASPRRAEHALVIASMSEQGSTLHSGERWFGVARDHGCYWLTLAPPAWLDEAVPGEVQADAAALAWDLR